MAEEQEGHYVHIREHSDLRERVAGLEMSVLHQMGSIRSDVSEIKAMLLRPQQQPDQASLALHRAIDALEKARPEPESWERLLNAIADRQQGNGASPILVGMSIIGALAIGYVLARYVMH